MILMSVCLLGHADVARTPLEMFVDMKSFMQFDINNMRGILIGSPYYPSGLSYHLRVQKLMFDYVRLPQAREMKVPTGSLTLKSADHHAVL